MANNTQKFYKGTPDEFYAWLTNLYNQSSTDPSAAAKYNDIKNSVVYISENINTSYGPLDVSNFEGAIYAHGAMLDCDESATIEDVQSAKSVGYITSGTQIPAGTTLQGLVDMIFTKVLGLDSAVNNPTASLSGVTAQTLEVASVIPSITATAAFSDGSWKNEESWKNEYSQNLPYQPFGCVAETYAFTGMITRAASTEPSAMVSDYPVAYGANAVNVTVTCAASVNVPVNQKGQDLSVGTVNDTTHYKPVSAGSVTAKSATITGDYKYWIGSTAYAAGELTRSILDSTASFTPVKTGWTGSSISQTDEYTTPHGSYVTIVIPSNRTLRTITDSFGNSVVGQMTMTEINGGVIGLDTTMKYKVYQQYAQAEAGLIRKLITIS